jgi:hypothetical protein
VRTLVPGDRVAIDIDLSLRFELGPGDYTIRVQRPDLARGFLSEEWGRPKPGGRAVGPAYQGPRAPELGSGQMLQSNEIAITVVP